MLILYKYNKYYYIKSIYYIYIIMPKKNIPQALRITVWNTFIGEEIGKSKCLCCNITDITQLKFHCGHIIAEAKGGLTHIDNLLPICESCNKSMGTQNLNEFKSNLLSNSKLLSFSEIKKKYIKLKEENNNNSKKVFLKNFYKKQNTSYLCFFKKDCIYNKLIKMNDEDFLNEIFKLYNDNKIINI